VLNTKEIQYEEHSKETDSIILPESLKTSSACLSDKTGMKMKKFHS
jgi:hypothetical protein